MLRDELIDLFYQVYDKLSPYGTIAPYSGAINAEKFADVILNLPELKEKLEKAEKWDEIVKYPCLWSKSDDDTGLWETSCGNEYMLIEGTPKNNRMDYCPFCGRKLG